MCLFYYFTYVLIFSHVRDAKHGRLYDCIDNRGDSFRRVQARPYRGHDHSPAFHTSLRRLRQGYVSQQRPDGEKLYRNWWQPRKTHAKVNRTGMRTFSKHGCLENRDKPNLTRSKGLVCQRTNLRDILFSNGTLCRHQQRFIVSINRVWRPFATRGHDIDTYLCLAKKIVTVSFLCIILLVCIFY